MGSHQLTSGSLCAWFAFRISGKVTSVAAADSLVRSATGLSSGGCCERIYFAQKEEEEEASLCKVTRRAPSEEIIRQLIESGRGAHR